MDKYPPVILDPQRAPYFREYRKRNRAKINEQMRIYYATHPEARMKRAARRKVYTEIRAGRLVAQPCCICGEKAEAHHHDYSKPLEITWLCYKHHAAHERITRISTKV